MKIWSNLIGNYKRLRNDNKNDRLVGTTYIRDYATGTDKFYEFEIPQAKMDPAQTITMQAEGKLKGLLSLNSINCWKRLKIA